MLFFIVLTSVCHAELRTWTSIVGTKVEAELVSLTGNQVTLKTKAGKTLKLSLNKLSKADQEFISSETSPTNPKKEEAPVSPKLKYHIEGDTVIIYSVITSFRSGSGKLVLPATIEGRPVTRIGNHTFRRSTGFTSITIPDSVTSIGYGAFGGCKSLSSITIGNSVTSIGEGAFRYCSNLTRITIPDSVTSIGDHAFLGCTGLTSITIGEGVTSIGNDAFRGCASLTSITLPDGVTSIEEGAFWDCTSLTTIEVGVGNVNYTVVNGVLFNKEKTVLFTYPAGKIGGNYNIPDTVTSIGRSAFAFCSSLTSVIIPESVTSIGEKAFEKFTGLTSITIPDSVTSIEEDAFSGCTGLTRITIPDSVTSIGPLSFRGCISLKGITIPGSVTDLWDYAFASCTNLAEVTFLGDAPKARGRKFTSGVGIFEDAPTTIYRKPEAKGWGETWGGRPVKLISEKP